MTNVVLVSRIVYSNFLTFKIAILPLMFIYCCTSSMIILIVSDCSTLNLNLNLIRGATTMRATRFLGIQCSVTCLHQPTQFYPGRFIYICPLACCVDCIKGVVRYFILTLYYLLPQSYCFNITKFQKYIKFFLKIFFTKFPNVN